MSCMEPKSSQEFDTSLDSALENDPYVVVYYTAVWCGPCRAIAPVFSNASIDNPKVRFFKVDIDQNQGSKRVGAISSVPKFEFYKNGTKVSEFSGGRASPANPQKHLADLQA
ncbi:thioredoxin [Cavenderia fasciculata]|uniref:Thioredoxin n=1 Tax=Cavenderia fasciculata TaxID=261658 RepID=F4PUC6_CACFS|nr:thioredoxin [Cavenderia fasciculata]EGG21841.1 thioredoxin [Cavenderia fasciculata]|eukprot:XP_004359691.1 thioredoxin [Cavenderia fasciculata]